jgi:hypothetical protein
VSRHFTTDIEHLVLGYACPFCGAPVGKWCRINRYTDTFADKLHRARARDSSPGRARRGKP